MYAARCDFGRCPAGSSRLTASNELQAIEALKVRVLSPYRSANAFAKFNGAGVMRRRFSGLSFTIELSRMRIYKSRMSWQETFAFDLSGKMTSPALEAGGNRRDRGIGNCRAISIAVKVASGGYAA